MEHDNNELDITEFDLIDFSKPVQNFKLLDLVEEIRQISETQKEFNFSILIEQDPTVNEYNYVCKILAIILKEHGKDSKPKFIHFDSITKHGLNYVKINKKRNQKPGINKPTFIDGSSVVKTFKDQNYIEFKMRSPNKRELDAIEAIRKKYDIPVPHVFKSERLTFDI